MASSIVVTDRQTLQENFVENGVNVFCNAAFGAGAYAIGGTLLGFPPLTVPAALLTTGALLGAMAVCPSRPTQEGIFGKPPDAPGGQCFANYRINGSIVYYVDATNTQFLDFSDQFFAGPLTVVNNLVVGPGPFPSSRLTIANRNGSIVRDVGAPNGIVAGSLQLSFAAFNNNGQPIPDNCGNQPNTGGQVITNITGDTINNNNVVNNQNHFEVIPILFNIGGVNGTLNMRFGDIKIDSLFPLNFDIDVGGVRIRLGEEPDGTYKIKPSNPDKTKPSTDLEKEVDDLRKLIEQIKECVCTPDVELEQLFMPFVESSETCEIQTETLLVPENSVSGSTYQKFQNSAFLAKKKCEEDNVEQKEEVLIYAATTTSNGRELFTPEIDVEVISLRVKITAVNNPGLEIISLYPEANQRKFGSVSYVLKDINGGGDYVYVFDQDTYIPLPRRAKKGKLRILFKAGISFEIYDTGER
jgi:hypothetical protein